MNGLVGYRKFYVQNGNGSFRQAKREDVPRVRNHETHLYVKGPGHDSCVGNGFVPEAFVRVTKGGPAPWDVGMGMDAKFYRRPLAEGHVKV